MTTEQQYTIEGVAPESELGKAYSRYRALKAEANAISGEVATLRGEVQEAALYNRRCYYRPSCSDETVQQSADKLQEVALRHQAATERYPLHNCWSSRNGDKHCRTRAFANVLC